MILTMGELRLGDVAAFITLNLRTHPSVAWLHALGPTYPPLFEERPYFGGALADSSLNLSLPDPLEG